LLLGAGNVSIKTEMRSLSIDRNDIAFALECVNDRTCPLHSFEPLPTTEVHDGESTRRGMGDTILYRFDDVADVKRVADQFATRKQVNRVAALSSTRKAVDKTVRLAGTVKTWQTQHNDP